VLKIVTIIGARPQFIKAANLSRHILQSKKISEIIIHTGQHYDNNMSEIFFNELGIPLPDYKLKLGGLSHGAMTGRMIEEIEKILIKEKPEFVVVYGDTNSTLAGAIAASKLNIKIAHIEAGLRSFNNQMPEEINRIVVDRISSILFCPNKRALNNLKKEGYQNTTSKLLNVGDIMFEGINFYKNKLEEYNFEKINFPFILATIHREENIINTTSFKNIFKSLSHISENNKVIFPLHPRTKNKIKNESINTGKIEFIEPVGYIKMIDLINKSYLIITDSGGMQKEAFFLKKPCVTLREETEWSELVENKVNVLVGSNYDKILSAFNLNWHDPSGFEKNLYGDGKTSEKIIKTLLNF